MLCVGCAAQRELIGQIVRTPVFMSLIRIGKAGAVPYGIGAAGMLRRRAGA